MPHITIEYSANLDRSVDIGALCNSLRAAAASLDIFPADGVRVRALRAEHFSIADGNPENAFMDISVRLREGRPLKARQLAIETLFAAARAALSTVIASQPIMLSLEMRNIHADLAPKLNTIRDRIEGAR